MSLLTPSFLPTTSKTSLKKSSELSRARISRRLGALQFQISCPLFACIARKTQEQTWLTGKNAYCPNFHTEWSSSRLQDLAIQTLLPLGLPNCTANNFHWAWARWANQAMQARQLFSSFCLSGLRRIGTAFFRLSDFCFPPAETTWSIGKAIQIVQLNKPLWHPIL